MRVRQLSVISITVKEENVTNHDLPVGWNIETAAGETYFFGPIQMSEKRKRNRWVISFFFLPPLVSSVGADCGTGKSG